MQTDLLCVGIAVMDYRFSVDVFPHEPGKYFATDYAEFGGGPAATAAVAATVLGGKATLWAELGADAVGDRLKAELTSYGVDTRFTEQRLDAQSSVTALLVDPSGERLIVNYKRPAQRQMPLTLPPDLELTDFKAVLADVRWPVATTLAFEAARSRGLPTILDADMSPDDVLSRLVPLADHAAFSQNGLARFSNESDPEQGLRKAASMCPGVVYVTLGSQGCLWLNHGQFSHQPAFKVAVRDTTGAGDVFHGALALALAEGQAIPQAVRFASAAAALKCEQPGGRTGIPDRARLNAFLEHFAL